MSVPLPASPTDNRFAVVSPDDNSAPLIIVAILAAIFAVLVLAVRIFIVKWKRHGDDDVVLGLAHVSPARPNPTPRSLPALSKDAKLIRDLRSSPWATGRPCSSLYTVGWGKL